MPYKNPQKAKEYARQYARKHKEERKISSRLWRKKNPERANAICKKYRERHRDERNKRIRERLAQRRKEPEFMFKQYKSGAKQRGHKWNLTFPKGMLIILSQRVCSNIPLQRAQSSKSAGLWRIYSH